MSANQARLFGKRLRALREAKGLKQHQLEAKIGKEPAYISRLETGRGSPSFEVIIDLARALDVPLSALFFFEAVDDDAKELRRKIENLLNASHVSQLRKFYRHMLVSIED